MGELLGVECLCELCKCLCQDPECTKSICCCCCTLCECMSLHGLEHFIQGCCTGCCHMLSLCLEGCASTSNSRANIHCVNFSCSCAALLLTVLAVFCCMVGTVSLTTAYQFGDNHCETPIDTHVVVQGIAMFGNGFGLLYVCCRYYSPTAVSFPYPDKPVFPRFHSLFVKDIPLTILMVTVSLGFWWSLLGYYWLSGVECDPADAFLLTMDSYAVGFEFVLVLCFLVLVYTVLGVAACDEGTCKYTDLQLDCFLCCCECCLKTSEDFQGGRRQRTAEARKEYPQQRNQCLALAMNTILLCGCIRAGGQTNEGDRNKDGMNRNGHRKEGEQRRGEAGRVAPVTGAEWRSDLDGNTAGGSRLVGLELAVRPQEGNKGKGEDTISKPS